MEPFGWVEFFAGFCTGALTLFVAARTSQASLDKEASRRRARQLRLERERRTDEALQSLSARVTLISRDIHGLAMPAKQKGKQNG